MKKLATRRQIYEACEMLETGRMYHSCLAVDMVTNRDGGLWSKETHDYARVIFDAYPGNRQEFSDVPESDRRDVRILCLLMYLEARNDV